MPGGARLPSRNGQQRGLGAGADTSSVHATLFTFPPPTQMPTPVRLPRLSHCGVTTLAGENNGFNLRAAAVQSARRRYTSSLKRTIHPSVAGNGGIAAPVSAMAGQPTVPSTLTSVESTRGPGSRKPTASFSCTPSPPPPPPPPPPLRSSSPPCSVTDNAEAQTSSSSLSTLLKNQQYAELYLVLSTLLPITSRRLLKDDAHTMRILGYRALCSGALLRFKESAEDGIACLDIRRLLRQTGCAPFSEDDQCLLARVAECVMRSLVMCERYDDAEKLASTPLLLLLSSSPQPPVSENDISGGADRPSAAERPAAVMASTWQHALPYLRQFRSAVALRQWRDALAAVEADKQAVTGACLCASPLCAMLAFVHLEAGHPMTARALLLAYLADLPEPPTWVSLSSTPSEYAQLWDSFRSHYVFATTLLAKTSVMSGSAYLNIAAALLQRCLRVLPFYTPARLLAEFVLSYEAQQKALAAAMSKQDFSAALRISARMLEMPELNYVLQAEVLLARAQVQWQRRLPLEVVREASQCIAADPECALAFRLRADALEEMNQCAEAVADRASAAAYASSNVVEAAYAELQAQRRRYDAAQRTSEARRRSFAAFTATTPAASLCHAEALWGSSDESGSTPPGEAEAAFTNRGAETTAETNPSFTRVTAAGVTSEPTYYDVLGVPPHAPLGDIRQRYRQLTLQCHPDRFVNASTDRRAQAAEEFKRVSNAYSVLSDPQQRSEYDATLHSRF
ncbi:DnaJ domain containing protein [Lotmaria passim]